MLQDVTPNRGSDVQGSPPPGDSFASDGNKPSSGGSRPNANNFDGLGSPTRGSQSTNISYTDGSKNSSPQQEPSAYEPGQSAREFYEAHNDGQGGYEPQLERPANFEGAYESQNAANFDDPEYLKGKQKPKRDVMAEARRAAARGKAGLVNRPTQYLGENLVGDKHAFRSDTPENRERVKRLAEEKIKKAAVEKIGKRLGDEGAKRVFQQGLTKGSGALAKKGLKKAGSTAAKAAAQTATKAATKVGVQAGTKAAQGAITAAGVGTGAASFGLGFLLSLLLNAAISLGLSDAIDAAFELKSGDLKKARFLASRAAAKVGMFVMLLVLLVTIVSVGGIIIALPLLIFTNVYMFAGFFLKNSGMMQGLVWWEIPIVILLDFMTFIFLATFIAGLGWWICNQSGFTGSSVGQIVATVYDWWTGSTYFNAVNDMCRAIKQF